MPIRKKTSNEIRAHLQFQEEGWGRMKAVARIKDQEWNTSIWFESQRTCYLLPVKASIRKKLNLKVGDIVSGEIRL